MSIWLLCNVGTRDVQLDDLAPLPPEIVNAKTEALIPRAAGAYLSQPDVLARFKDQIRMPMVERALQFIAPQDKGPVHLVLFATDQPEAIAARFRDGDTITYAHLMREVLFARFQGAGLRKKAITVRTTASNPADYDLMYDFYRAELPQIARRVGDDPGTVYLLIAGGTPQMNTMLLFVGSETFSARACPIYVSPGRDRAEQLDILRQIYQQAFRRSLEVLLNAYAYGPALHLIAQEQEVLEPWQAALLTATMCYADARRNLNLAAAAAAFDAVLPATRALRESVRMLQQEVASATEVNLLLETIYLAQLAVETGDWANFLARLHRFSEGCLQALAERLGVRWSNIKDRSSYQQEWWDTYRAMLAGLKLADPDPPAVPATEATRRQVDRANLRTIVVALAEAQERGDELRALDDLVEVDRPVPLRNAIVHRFTPISQDEVERKAGQSAQALIARMRGAYQYLFGVVVTEDHPYAYINRLCAAILAGPR